MGKGVLKWETLFNFAPNFEDVDYVCRRMQWQIRQQVQGYIPLAAEATGSRRGTVGSFCPQT